MTKTVLILGSTGRFGRNACDAFWNAGWTVRRFNRTTDDLLQASAGADVIVNGWNPPYTDWAAELIGLTSEVIKAARQANATLLQPANIYVYGAGSPKLLSSSTPHCAENPLGRIRIEMEALLQDSGVRTILLRAGDYIDDQPSGNWFDRVIAAKVARGRLSYPGDPDVDHAWAYLPDIARAAVALAEIRDQLDAFEDILFAGYTLSGRDLVRHAEEAVGRTVRLTKVSWLPIQVARPVWPMAKHLLEMRYLWSMPHRLDDARFKTLVPDFRATPASEAIATALAFQRKVDPDQPMSGREASVVA